MPPRLQMTLLRLWHAWLAGGFLVAWLTADEDTYAMHQFSGYAVLAALALRLMVAMVAPAASPWRLPRPKLPRPKPRGNAKGRNPLLAWCAAALLISITLAAALGALADGLSWLEHPHEALANLALWVICAHVGLVVFLFGGKRLLARYLPWLGFKEKLS